MNQWRYASVALCVAFWVGCGGGLAAPLTARADVEYVGTTHVVSEGGRAVKVETPDIGGPPSPLTAVLWAEKHGYLPQSLPYVPPITTHGCTISLPDNVSCNWVPASSTASTSTTCAEQPGPGPCDDGDPYDQNCVGNGESQVAYNKAVWDSSSGTYVETFQQWSQGCQSNWAIGQMDNNNGIVAAMAYNGQPDSNGNFNYDTNTTCENDQGTTCYSNMLYGAPGTPCTTALAMYAAGNPTAWRHTDCIGN